MPTPRPADAVGLIPGGVAGEVQPVGPAPCVGGAAQRSGSESVESPALATRRRARRRHGGYGLCALHPSHQCLHIARA